MVLRETMLTQKVFSLTLTFVVHTLLVPLLSLMVHRVFVRMNFFKRLLKTSLDWIRLF